MVLNAQEEFVSRTKLNTSDFIDGEMMVIDYG